MRLLLRLLAVTGLIALLAGCVDDGATGALLAARQSTARPVAAALVNGFWRVHDAVGEPGPSWLQLSTDSVTLYRPKGAVFGAWVGQGEAIAVLLDGWSMSLGTAHDAPWLAAAAHLRRDRSGWLLLDVHGRTVARLVRDGRPAPSPELMIQPTPIGPAPSALHDARPGPGVTDRPASAIEGRWRIAAFPRVTIVFDPDGSWRTKPPCPQNGVSGGYRVLTGGMLLMTSGFIGGVGCGAPGSSSPAVRVITDAADARSFRVDGDRLTLFDAAGRRLGALIR